MGPPGEGVGWMVGGVDARCHFALTSPSSTMTDALACESRRSHRCSAITAARPCWTRSLTASSTIEASVRVEL